MINKSKRKLRIRKRFFVPGIFVIAILLITYLFPRQGNFKYSFSEGRPWQYGLLTAPFDFSVYKSAEQLQQEQDSILKFYEPYFTIDSKIQRNAMAEFDADVSLDSKLQELSPSNILYIRNKLQEIYAEGIMQSEDYDKILSSETQSFRLREGNVAQSKRAQSINTIRSAYEEILTSASRNIDIAKLDRKSVV